MKKYFSRLNMGLVAFVTALNVSSFSYAEEVPATLTNPQIAELGKKITVQIEPEFAAGTEGPKLGSGVLIGPSAGIVVTNNHLVKNAVRVVVRTHKSNGGLKLIAEAANILTDPSTDMAIIKLDATATAKLATGSFGDSDKLSELDPVVAIGSPYGLTSSVSKGEINGLHRTDVNDPTLKIQDFIQTDVSSNQGGSGGPLLNMQGEVIGIVTRLKSMNGANEGIVYATSSNLIKKRVEQLVEKGKLQLGYLGLAIEDMDTEMLQKYGLTNGVLVTVLAKGDTPAKAAKLQKTDIITQVGDIVIDTKRQFLYAIAHAEIGKPIKLHFQRGGQMQETMVTIEERPADYDSGQAAAGANETAAIPKLGIEVQTLSTALAVAAPYNWNKDDVPQSGVMITKVTAASAAEKAGIQPGMILTRVEKKSVIGPNALMKKIADEATPTGGFLLELEQRDGSTSLVVVQ